RLDLDPSREPKGKRATGERHPGSGESRRRDLRGRERALIVRLDRVLCIRGPRPGEQEEEEERETRGSGQRPELRRGAPHAGQLGRWPLRGSTGSSARTRGRRAGASEAKYASIAISVAFRRSSSGTSLSKVSRSVCQV